MRSETAGKVEFEPSRLVVMQEPKASNTESVEDASLSSLEEAHRNIRRRKVSAAFLFLALNMFRCFLSLSSNDCLPLYYEVV